MRKKTKNEAEIKRKKCVELAKKIAILLVNGICEHCGRKKEDGWQMHGSHIYPEGVYKSMSAMVLNILCLCAACHTGGFWKNSHKPSWHEDPIYFANWFRRKYPQRARKLEIISRENKQCDEYFWTQEYKKLKNKYKKLCQKKLIINKPF